MKKSLKAFKGTLPCYRAKEVMYATATKQAKERLMKKLKKLE
jgi:hypothetical protein